MKLFLFVLRRAPRLFALSCAIGLLSGASQTLIVGLINSALSRREDTTLVLAYAAACLGGLATNFGSHMLLMRLGHSMIREIRNDLAKALLRVPLQRLEAMGPGKVTATLTGDVQTLTITIPVIPVFVVQTAIVVGCLAYLAWLSPLMSVGVGLFLAASLFTVTRVLAGARQGYQRSRKLEDELHSHYRGLIDGFKDLKVRASRRSAFVNQLLEPTTRNIEHEKVRAEQFFVFGWGLGRTLFVVLIGVLLFGAAEYISDPVVLRGYTFTVLFMVSPVEWMGLFTMSLAQANIALNRINTLFDSAKDVEPGSADARVGTPLTVLQLRGISFRYASDDRSFSLGPIDFEVSPGEIVFVTGGNGSGKTSFLKLMVGLYAPHAGTISCNGQIIDDATRMSYRELFATVFFDFYLFDRLLGIEKASDDADARAYLRKLALDSKLEIADGRLSTTQLSQGQRKRLALLVAYLDDKPIYVFDEWAADQDPDFKNVFYRELLPELRARGKAVVAITHDDRFFSVADRIVKFENGKLVNVQTPAAATAAAEVASTV